MATFITRTLNVLTVFFVISLSALAYCQQGIGDQPHPTAEELIQKFSLSHNASDLALALDSMKRSFFKTQDSSKHDIDPRMIELAGRSPDSPLLTVWLKFYSVLDPVELLARKEKWPTTCVSPPVEKNSPSPYLRSTYSCGVAPESIADPVLRKQYEEAISENERRRLASINYAQIRNIRMSANSFFWLWATALKHDDLKAQTAIVSEAGRLGCSNTRAEWIRAIVSAQKGTFAPPDKPAE